MRTRTLFLLAAVLCLLAVAAKLAGLDVPALIAIFLACAAVVLALVQRGREHGEYSVSYTDKQREEIAAMLRLGDERGAITQTHCGAGGSPTSRRTRRFPRLPTPTASSSARRARIARSSRCSGRV